MSQNQTRHDEINFFRGRFELIQDPSYPTRLEIPTWEHLKLKLYVIEDWGKCVKCTSMHAKLGCQVISCVTIKNLFTILLDINDPIKWFAC
jgi:hypothetical protein